MRLQVPPGRREHRIDMGGRSRRHGGAVGGAERALFEIGEGGPEILPDQLAAIRNLRLGPPVEVGEPPRPVEHEHAVGGALQRRPQAALAQLQPLGHDVDGGAEPVERRAVGRQAGARREVAAGQVRDRPQQPLRRPPHQMGDRERHQPGRQQRRQHDQRNAAPVGPIDIGRATPRCQARPEPRARRAGCRQGHRRSTAASRPRPRRRQLPRPAGPPAGGCGRSRRRSGRRSGRRRGPGPARFRRDRPPTRWRRAATGSDPATRPASPG